MTTLQVFSDLHLEFEGGLAPRTLQLGNPWKTMTATDSDVVILAGDTATKGRGPQLARELFPERPIVMVAGNHEYYGQSYQRHLAKLKESAAQLPDVHFLERDAIVLGDTVFLGCTLWTDCRLWESGPHEGLHPYSLTLMELSGGMNDYGSIRYFDGRSHRVLRPADTIREHQKSVRWLREQLEIHQGKRVVVVTHHAPSFRSIAPEFRADILSAAYASHLDELVEHSGALLWVHGHTHCPADYRTGDTRVISNPRGYPQQGLDFKPDLTVEI